MKLPNQIHGPVTLTKIDYAANLSQETLAFTADLEIHGLRGRARNDGHGGATFVEPHAVREAVSAYAATLPRLVSEHFPEGLAVDDDILINDMVSSAIKARDYAKMRAKGFTHLVSAPSLTSMAFYQRSANLPPNAELLKIFKGVRAPLAEIKAQLQVVAI
jgi:hypothetical protein